MNTVQQPIEWSIKAQNLPEHARNPIHTDAGAQAAGFPRALVAGVTTYAYLTHPLIVAWGEDWLARQHQYELDCARALAGFGL